MFFLPCVGVHFPLNIFVLASESFIILMLFCHCSSDPFKINFGFAGYESTSRREEGIGGYNRDNKLYFIFNFMLMTSLWSCCAQKCCRVKYKCIIYIIYFIIRMQSTSKYFTSLEWLCIFKTSVRFNQLSNSPY